MKRFGLVCADPPWQFNDKLPGPKRGAASHYPCLSTSELARFPLPPLLDDCVLVLWRVGTMVEEAYFVMRAWGFKPNGGEIVWAKTSPKNPTRLRIGMGRSVRNCHEVAIIGTRGRPKRLSASEPSVIVAPRTEHSRKPQEAYDLVRRLYPGPFCELFATSERDGWTCFGNAIGKEITP